MLPASQHPSPQSSSSDGGREHQSSFSRSSPRRSFMAIYVWMDGYRVADRDPLFMAFSGPSLSDASAQLMAPVRALSSRPSLGWTARRARRHDSQSPHSSSPSPYHLQPARRPRVPAAALRPVHNLSSPPAAPSAMAPRDNEPLGSSSARGLSLG